MSLLTNIYNTNSAISDTITRYSVCSSTLTNFRSPHQKKNILFRKDGFYFGTIAQYLSFKESAKKLR